MNDVFEIVSKKINGTLLSIPEEQLFQDWYAMEENKVLYADLEKVWSLTGNVSIDLKIDVDAEWESFLQKRDQNKIHRIYGNQVFKFTAIAASIILLLGVFGVFYINSSSVLYQTAENTEQVKLPDNSIIWLNSNSKLKVQNGFNIKNRNVFLIGEAYFEITRNENLPFTVETENGLKAKVLGTCFNLQVNQQTKIWHLNVFSGKVWFGSSNSNSLIVEKQQQVLFDRNTYDLEKLDHIDSNAIAWKTKELRFDNTPMEDVVNQLSQYLSKQIVVPNSTENLYYTGNFINPTDNDIAEIISLAMGWDYKITNKAIIFSTKRK